MLCVDARHVERLRLERWRGARECMVSLDGLTGQRLTGGVVEAGKRWDQ